VYLEFTVLCGYFFLFNVILCVCVVPNHNITGFIFNKSGLHRAQCFQILYSIIFKSNSGLHEIN
jgi:hypothetical protein